MTSPVEVSWGSPWSEAMPKSASLAVPRSGTMTLPGLTSRWTIPAAWAASSALAIWAPISATRSTGSGPLDADQVGQRRRVDQLHDDEGAAPVLDDVVQGDRGRVVEPGGGPRLPHHPRLGRAPLLLGHGRREHHFLDRDLATQDRILGTPDNAHPSPPEGGSERVAIGDQAVRGRFGHTAPPYPLVASTNRSGRWWDK